MSERFRKHKANQYPPSPKQPIFLYEIDFGWLGALRDEGSDMIQLVPDDISFHLSDITLGEFLKGLGITLEDCKKALEKEDVAV